MLKPFAEDIDGPAGHSLRWPAYYRSGIDINPAFLNDGLHRTCEVWISYEVFIGLSTSRCSGRQRYVDDQRDSVQCSQSNKDHLSSARHVQISPPHSHYMVV